MSLPERKKPRSRRARWAMIVRRTLKLGADSECVQLRNQIGLQADRATAMVLFGGCGSKVILGISERLDAEGLPLQLILICDRSLVASASLRPQIRINCR